MLGGFDRFFDRGGHSARSLRNIEFFQQFAETFPVFCEVDGLGRRANNRYARSLQRQREVERSLSAELHNHADRRT